MTADGSTESTGDAGDTSGTGTGVPAGVEVGHPGVHADLGLGAGGASGIGDDQADADTIGAEDVAWLNGRAVERAGAFTRLAGMALIVAGALGVAAWLWITVRQQQMIDDADGGRFAFGDGEPSLVDRIDALVDYLIFLPWGALTVGAGFGLRLAADYTAARTGGSLTRFTVGDPVPDGGLANDPQPVEVDPFA